MKHYEYEISLFVDNELPFQEGKEMFAHLSECKECSGFFADTMKMKKGIAKHYQEMDSEITPTAELIKDLYVVNKSSLFVKAGFAASIAAVFIMGYFLYATHITQSLLENKYNRLYTEVSALKGSINTTDSSVQTESAVKPETKQAKRNDVLKSRQLKKNNDETEKDADNNNTEMKAPPRYTFQYASLPSIEIKKEDFLVQQMVGN